MKKASSKTGDPDEMQRSILGQYFRVVELILTFGLVEYRTNRLITDYFEEGTDVMSTQGVNLILEARKALTYEPVDADLFNLRLISAFMAWQEAWHGAHDAG